MGRKTVESNDGPCPKRPESQRTFSVGHLFQSATNTPPWWCIYCDRLAIVPPDPRLTDGCGTRAPDEGAKP